jgi:hypothetical protein
MRLVLVLVSLSILSSACADQTGILVQITSSDIAVPAGVDGLTIRAHTPDELMTDQSFAIRSSWPQSLLIRPARGEALGDIRVDVIGTLGGAFVVRRSVMTAFIPGQVRRVDVELSRACAGVMCAADVDCIAGVCQGMAIDGGVHDASVGDAGNDAAVIVDVGVDAGMDVGTDVGTDANVPCAGATCVGHVVISEMSTYMSNEFVELYNRGGTTADLSGCAIEHFLSGAWSPRGTLAAGTTIPSHGYYLAANAGYTGTPAPDAPALWSTGFLDSNAAVRLSCGGITIDLLGYGTTGQREGTAATAITPSMLATASYERKAQASSTATTMASGGADATAGNGYDTDDNASDFVIREMRDPQSSASPHEP